MTGALPMSPVVAGWELTLRLRRRREELGLDVKAITDEMGFSRNYWSAIENERKLLTEENLGKIIELFEFDRDEGRELLDLRAVARGRGWWDDYADLFDGPLRRHYGMEDGVDELRGYEGIIVPGLLQIPDYTRAIMGPAVTVPRVEIDQRIEARQRRQERLTGDKPLRLTVIMSEAVLRQQIGGPALQRRQLVHLVEMMEAHPDTINIRVIPFTAKASGLFGSATVYIFDFENPVLPTLVWHETVTVWGFIDNPTQVRDVVTTYDTAFDITQSATESVSMIYRCIQELA